MCVFNLWDYIYIFDTTCFLEFLEMKVPRICDALFGFDRVTDVHLSHVKEESWKKKKRRRKPQQSWLTLFEKNLLFCTFNTFDFSWEPSQL